MKIAHITSIYDVVNSEMGSRMRLIYLLANMQQKQGHEVTIFAAKKSSAGSCKIVSLSNTKPIYNGRIRSWIWRRAIESIYHVESYRIIDKSFDVIHNHLLEEAAITGRLSRINSITTIHGGIPTDLAHKLLMKTYGAINKTKLVAISKYSYDIWKEIAPKNLAGYVYNCINPNEVPFSNSPSPSDRIKLCFVSRCVPEKGCHLAIKAVDELNKQGIPSQLYMAIIPYYGYGTYYLQLLKMAKKRPYITIETIAEKNRLFEQVANSDAMLCPIIAPESFGYVFIESMACGTPVIAFARGSPQEIITDGKTGFLCRNIDEMIKAVPKALELDRRKCRERVEKAFSVKATYEGYMRVYKDS